MSATQSTKAWKRLSGELLAATDRDFERAVLPLARALWPALIQPRGMKDYDRAGADLVAFGDDDVLTAVIQCKGLFKAEGLQDDQFAPIAKSIASFQRSGLKAETFVIVHNQDGRNKTVAAKVEVELAKLVTSGAAGKTIQWDRTSFLKALESRLRAMVSERVGEQSRHMLEQMERQFSHGRTYVANVPVTHKMLSLRRGRPPQIRQAHKNRTATNIAGVLAKSDARWTLLTGLFGAGKTSAALQAARLYPNKMLYVHAGTIEPKFGEGGTNSVMARILDSLSVFGDFPDDERGLFERLAGPMLRQLLQANDANSVLIIDALDENRALSSPDAVMRFASALAELRCPVILTTREEHFRATFGNFDHLFDELSTKGGNLNELALLELEPWDDRQILDLVDAATREAPTSGGLRDLQRAFKDKSRSDWRADLLRHPFFLRMIIDLAADDHRPSINQAELVRDWIWAKLSRDLKAARSTPVPVHDRNRYIEQMEAFMTAVAGEMMELDAGIWRLADTIASDRVIALCEQILGASGIDLGSAIAVTLLIPTTARFRGAVPVRFSHRAFQEYFTARHVIETSADSHHLPIQIRAFCDDLAQLEAEPTSI